MTEAYSEQCAADGNEADSLPLLELVEGGSEAIRYMFALLMDGNARVVDYRGSEERGGQPARYVDPQAIARPVLRAIRPD